MNPHLGEYPTVKYPGCGTMKMNFFDINRNYWTDFTSGQYILGLDYVKSIIPSL